jgi:hypothetical protein
MTKPYAGVGLVEFDVERFRAELKAMTDAELIECGKSLAFICSKPVVHPPGVILSWPIQLDKARAEWRRRRSDSRNAQPKR